MRRSIAVLFLCVLVMASEVAAQDSFGGYPAAPPSPNAPAAPAAPAAPTKRTPTAKVPATPSAPAAPAVDPNDPERQDLGVPATNELHSGGMHAPTPNTIPGGQVITTRGVVALLGNAQLGAKIFDVLGWSETIPGAIPAVPAHQAGTFDDQTQREFGGFLNQVTQGNKQTPLVFYCMSKECWMSYNASLRAIHMGYTNVLWYRGGIEAWKAAGQKVEPARR